MDAYALFERCFPALPMSREVFEELCGDYELIEDDCGFAMVHENNIRLLCVEEERRRRGTGTALVKKAEEHIKNNGYDKAIVGGTSSRLFIGAPVPTKDSGEPFFESLGYTHSVTCAEMGMDIAGFKAAEHDIPVPEGVTFGYRSCDDKLREAVAAVEEGWVKYYQNGKAFCALMNGEIASFCLTDTDETCLLSDGGRVGSVGCVGTVPKFRRRGIGLKMVALATEELAKAGCDKCFIHYTGVYDWYAKLGYKTFLWTWFGSKEL